ncbi:hypothetical protein O6H91_05G076600 [Diphasiastrum complanatum]|uniref:Uncharacterized protein n=2 Tax=Diphasiastrum complanatum TaxID=34168 RepID=A0ACC2DPZ8_DIPCM|nr:hypothetical protein O6H91_05G076600 [Diphasiastrum complanatum]KAJ7556267.1 hypothetical protein O6H91_05G076600 [Diphasiastrum complanatum]
MSLWMVLRTAVSFTGPTATLLYPLYASIKALEGPSKEDDEQWLTYWMLYSFLELFELAAGNALAWIPVWPFIKLAIISWLVLPQFQGAAFVYVHIIRKHVQKLQEQSGKRLTEDTPGKNLTADKSDVLDFVSPEAPASTERFIEENGEEALEKNMEMPAEEVANNLPSPIKEQQERY